MTKKGRSSDHEQSAIAGRVRDRMLERDVARIAQTIVEIARGLDLDAAAFGIHLRRGKTKKTIEIDLSVPVDLEDKIRRHFMVKVWAPEKDTLTINGRELTIRSATDELRRPKPTRRGQAEATWGEAERKKSATPKERGGHEVS